MTARIRKLLSDLAETFWLVPALMVVVGVLLAVGLVELDRSGIVPPRLLETSWLYNGGGTGARTLLGAVASSTIGVAGTVFSITIAALSLAAGQMGPRLLRNFTRDRGNQITLGAFLGTFSYALMVLRSVRTQSEGEFMPHLSLSVGILLAFVCVGDSRLSSSATWPGRINVDTVIDLVSDDVQSAIAAADDRRARPMPRRRQTTSGADAVPVVDARRGYLQQLDDRRTGGLGSRTPDARSACWCGPVTTSFPARRSPWSSRPCRRRRRRDPQRDGAGTRNA